MHVVSTQTRLPNLAEEELRSRRAANLVGLLDERHHEDALEIWKNLVGLPRLTQFELGHRVQAIHAAAAQIMEREAHSSPPSPREDRRELAQLFRGAAVALVSCASNLDWAAEGGTPLLMHARRLEATFA